MKIGLSYTGNEDKHNNYRQWLAGNENVEVIKLRANETELERIEDCDALVLSGGIDIDPLYYNGTTDYPGKPNNFDSARDAFELLLLSQAVSKSIPVLGICRGLQLINVYFKGTLVQDIGQRKIEHRGNPDKEHLVQIDEGTLLSDITRVESEFANSAHHQAINIMGDNLMANCYSDDGLIEGIEWKDKTSKPFLLAVQWHPERMRNLQSPLSKNIRNRFITETKVNMKRI